MYLNLKYSKYYILQLIYTSFTTNKDDNKNTKCIAIKHLFQKAQKIYFLQQWFIGRVFQSGKLTFNVFPNILHILECHKKKF